MDSLVGSRRLRRIGKLTSKKSYVRLVFVADALATWSLVADVETVRNTGASIVSLTPWHDSALQHWLDEAGFANVSRSDRERITQVTGNWPVLQEIFHQRCRSALHAWREALDRLEADTSGKQKTEGLNLERLFGIDRAEARLLLNDLAILEEASAEELSALNSELPVEVAEHALKWGALLQSVSRSEMIGSASIRRWVGSRGTRQVSFWSLLGGNFRGPLDLSP